MSNPIPHVVEESGDAEDAPNGSIPIALYGAGGGGGGGPVEWDDIENVPAPLPNLVDVVEESSDLRLVTVAGDGEQQWIDAMDFTQFLGGYVNGPHPTEGQVLTWTMSNGYHWATP